MLKLKSDKSFVEFLKANGNLLRVGVILALGVALIIIGSLAGADKNDPETTYGLEDRLAEMCSEIEGVGECRVMITYSEDGERVYAVAVLCDGGDSVAVREKVTELIGSLFGIGSNRISVLKIKK